MPPPNSVHIIADGGGTSPPPAAYRSGLPSSKLAAGARSHITSQTAGSGLTRRIPFVPARRVEAPSDGLAAWQRAAGLNPSDVLVIRHDDDTAVTQQGGAMPSAHNKRQHGHATARYAGVARSQKELFRQEDLKMKWSTVKKTGSGLVNLGNTCFMNSVLQCLIHTPPLAEQCLAGKQLGRNPGGVDILQMTQDQIVNSFRTTRGAMPPVPHAKSLRQISRSFRLGRQEDAHEYLRCLLDALHESCLKGMTPRPPPEITQTTLINQIFGGRLCSQVKCLDCKYESNTYEPFLDLSLGINRAHSVVKALQHFTAGEVLMGDNAYKCPKTSTYVKAVKRITIDRAPNVLTLQLKRFEFGGFGHKISKKVDFETELNLAPFVMKNNSSTMMYDLYAVLVHAGHSVHSGHYYCFVRGPNGMWHAMDDNRVSQVSERVVLGQKAYILFYIKRHAEKKPSSAGADIREKREPKISNGPDSRSGNGKPSSSPFSATVSTPAIVERKTTNGVDANAERINTGVGASSSTRNGSLKITVTNEKANVRNTGIGSANDEAFSSPRMPNGKRPLVPGSPNAHSFHHKPPAISPMVRSNSFLRFQQLSTDISNSWYYRTLLKKRKAAASVITRAKARAIMEAAVSTDVENTSPRIAPMAVKEAQRFDEREAPGPPATEEQLSRPSRVDVKQWLAGDRGKGQFSLAPGRWETASAEEVERAEALAAATKTKARQRDSWDVDYDRGKTKKTKRKVEEAEGGNLFHQAWKQKKTGSGVRNADGKSNRGRREGSRGAHGGRSRGGRRGGHSSMRSHRG